MISGGEFIAHARSVPDFCAVLCPIGLQATSPEVGKHRLHRTDALAVKPPFPWAVSGLAHALTRMGQILGFGFGHNVGDVVTPSIMGLERAFEAWLAQSLRLVRVE